MGRKSPFRRHLTVLLLFSSDAKKVNFRALFSFVIKKTTTTIVEKKVSCCAKKWHEKSSLVMISIIFILKEHDEKRCCHIFLTAYISLNFRPRWGKPTKKEELARKFKCCKMRINLVQRKSIWRNKSLSSWVSFQLFRAIRLIITKMGISGISESPIISDNKV